MKFFRSRPNINKLAARRNLDGLIKALGDSDYFIRRDAAYALGKISDIQAVDPLIASLNDEDDTVRAAAAGALGEIGDAKAVDRLIALLQRDNYVSARSSAATSLGKIGDRSAIPFLNNARTNEHDFVRKAAIEALKQLGELIDDIQFKSPQDTKLNEEMKSLIQKLSLRRRSSIEMMHPEKVEAWKRIKALGQPAVEPLLMALDENGNIETLCSMIGLLAACRRGVFFSKGEIR